MKRFVFILAVLAAVLAVGASSAVAAPPNKPLKPAKLTLVSLTANPAGPGWVTWSSTLRWTKVPGATVYEVCSYSNWDSSVTCTSGITGTTYTSEGPTMTEEQARGTTFYWYVLACPSSDPTAVCSQSNTVSGSWPGA